MVPHLSYIDFSNNIIPQGKRFKLILIGFLLSIIFRVDITNPPLYYIVLTFALGIYFSVFFLPRQLLIYPLFLIILVMPDLTQSNDELDILGLINSANLWQFSIGYLTPAVLVFIMLAVVLIRLLPIHKPFPFKILLFYFIIFVPLVSIYFGFLQNSFARFFSDFKIVTFFCTGLVIFHCYFSLYKDKLWELTQIFIFLALGNFCVDFFKLFFQTNNTQVEQSYYNLSMDSAKGLISIFFFYSVLSMKNLKSFLLNMFSIGIVIILLVSYQTRWLLVTLFLGILLMLFYFSFFRVLKIGFLTILFCIITIPVLNFLNPEPWRIMMLRFGFIENLGKSSEVTDLELARGSAIINSVSTVSSYNAYLTGLGYGSWYSDSYFPMPNLTTAAFDEDSLRKGQFFRVHDFTFHFLFKFGFIGIYLYSIAFLKPIKEIWKNKAELFISEFNRKILLIYIGILPMVLTFMFATGKALLFSALYIITFKFWIDYIKEYSTTRYNIYK